MEILTLNGNPNFEFPRLFACGMLLFIQTRNIFIDRFAMSSSNHRTPVSRAPLPTDSTLAFLDMCNPIGEAHADSVAAPDSDVAAAAFDAAPPEDSGVTSAPSSDPCASAAAPSTASTAPYLITSPSAACLGAVADQLNLRAAINAARTTLGQARSLLDNYNARLPIDTEFVVSTTIMIVDSNKSSSTGAPPISARNLLTRSIAQFRLRPRDLEPHVKGLGIKWPRRNAAARGFNRMSNPLASHLRNLRMSNTRDTSSAAAVKARVRRGKAAPAAACGSFPGG